jgi:hypothetical protein
MGRTLAMSGAARRARAATSSVKVKLSDLPDLFGVLQDGVSTLIETILGDIEDIQVGVIRIK